MRGTIESIEERKTKKGKPYHLVKIDGEAYWVWEASFIKGISKGMMVDFESEGDEYPKITSIGMCPEGTPSPQKQASRYDDTKVWNTCVMCAKDIMVALINSDRLPKQASPITEIKAIAIDMAKTFYQASENGVVEEDPAPETGMDETGPEGFTTLKEKMMDKIMSINTEQKVNMLLPKDLTGDQATQLLSFLKEMPEDDKVTILDWTEQMKVIGAIKK